MTVPAFGAEATAANSTDWDLGDDELVEATVQGLTNRRHHLVSEPVRVRYTTTIPRQVGLGGSSAIIIATLRALANRTAQDWDPVELARVALEIETDVLGGAAGPQDRVVQAYEGLIDMNFATPWDAASYHRLDPAQLPPLFVAWDQNGGASSDSVHADVRARWHRGDTEVIQVMSEFALLATHGRQSLDEGTACATWPDLLRQSFALRRRLWTIDATNQQLVAIGTDLGAGVTFAGSSGAVVGALADPDGFATLQTQYEQAGFGFLVLTS